jgi:hypothetical protein
MCPFETGAAAIRFLGGTHYPTWIRTAAKARYDAITSTASEVLAAFHGHQVAAIVLGRGTTRWSVRVHGGHEGRSLSDRFREAAG